MAVSLTHMTSAGVSLSASGPPETVLSAEPAEAVAMLESARCAADDPNRDTADEIGQVCTGWPTCLEAWAALGEEMERMGHPALAYAAFRTGYHRGLDRLRAGGWRGSGYVRWRHQPNRGFLRALDGLRRVAAQIGETGEEQRCALFLSQLDPDWPPPADP